jgi:hypothetical protein
MQFALQGALSRPQALSIRQLSFEFRSHMGRDGGVRTTGASVLGSEKVRFRHALMILDHEGCGQETASVQQLETELNRQLAAVWGEHAKAIVIEPEVDIWLWGTDNALREALRWPQEGPIRDWLRQKGFEFSAEGKPLRPKEALEAMRLIHKQPRSSALYQKITEKISLQKCTDPAFLRLKAHMQKWFGTTST